MKQCFYGMSLPLRERGLKSRFGRDRSGDRASLPLRERGLKFLMLALHSSEKLSLPLRERGLKSFLMMPFALRLNVAPPAGAWIEIH